MRREGVVRSIEAKDGHGRSGQLLVRTRITIIIDTGFVTELQSREAFVKLADRPRLEKKRAIVCFSKTLSSDRTKVEKCKESPGRVRTFRT